MYNCDLCTEFNDGTQSRLVTDFHQVLGSCPRTSTFFVIFMQDFASESFTDETLADLARYCFKKCIIAVLIAIHFTHAFEIDEKVNALHEEIAVYKRRGFLSASVPFGDSRAECFCIHFVILLAD